MSQLTCLKRRWLSRKQMEAGPYAAFCNQVQQQRVIAEAQILTFPVQLTMNKLIASAGSAADMRWQEQPAGSPPSTERPSSLQQWGRHQPEEKQSPKQGKEAQETNSCLPLTTLLKPSPRLPRADQVCTYPR